MSKEDRRRADWLEVEVERLRAGIRALADDPDGCETTDDGLTYWVEVERVRALLSPSPAATTGEAIQSLVDVAPDLNPNALQRLVKVTRQIEQALRAGDENELRGWLRTAYRTALQDDDAVDWDTGLPVERLNWEHCVGCGTKTGVEAWCSACRQRNAPAPVSSGEAAHMGGFTDAAETTGPYAVGNDQQGETL